MTSPGSTLAELSSITKFYNTDEGPMPVLTGVDLKLNAGEMVALVGPSGSGKSTLLHILGCLDRQTTGSYRLFGKDVASLNDEELAAMRALEIGFVFQNFFLAPRLNALRNVERGLRYNSRVPRDERGAYARRALETVGLSDRTAYLPSQLSGGQKQRVALARAIVGGARLVLADEPTGNLDPVNAGIVVQLLRKLCHGGACVLVVTHSSEVANACDRRCEVSQGRVTSWILNKL